jgi:hypothetical protein
MGFVQRAFTPPGTGGAEAAAIQAQTNAQRAIDAANAKMAQMSQMPTAPEAPKPPGAPPQFMPGQGPGDKQKAARTSTILGQTAAASQQSRKVSVLG